MEKLRKYAKSQHLGSAVMVVLSLWLALSLWRHPENCPSPRGERTAVASDVPLSMPTRSSLGKLGNCKAPSLENRLSENSFP